MKEFTHVAALRKLVDQKAEAFEPGVFNLLTIESAVEEWAAIEKRACAMKLKAAARAEELGLDAEQAVANSSGLTSSQARKQTQLRKRLHGKQATADALDRGQLSPRQASAIADAVDANPDAESSLLDLAETVSASDLLTQCDRVKRDALDADGGLAARQRAARSLRHWKNAIGNTVGSFELEPVKGAGLIADLERRANRMFREQVRAGGAVDTLEQRMADALMEVLSSSGDTGKRRGPRTHVYLLASKAAVDRGTLRPGEKCETADGEPIPLRAVDDALMDPDTQVTAIISNVVEDVTSIVSYTRYWPERVLDALIARGLVCEVPGCGRTKGLQKDHHRDFAKGGPTSAGNGGFKCDPHHKLKTRGLYDMRVDENGVKRWQPTPRGQSPPRSRAAG